MTNPNEHNKEKKVYNIEDFVRNKPRQVNSNRGGRPQIKVRDYHPTDADYDKILLRIDKSEDGCWYYRGTFNKYNGSGKVGSGEDRKGYAAVTIHGEPAYVTHVMFHWKQGRWPIGELLRHTCNHSTCCNPDHLVEGTHLDNMIDRRGRRMEVKRLNRKQVENVLMLYYVNKWRKSKISNALNILYRTVFGIIKGTHYYKYRRRLEENGTIPRIFPEAA